MCRLRERIYQQKIIAEAPAHSRGALRPPCLYMMCNYIYVDAPLHAPRDDRSIAFRKQQLRVALLILFPSLRDMQRKTCARTTIRSIRIHSHPTKKLYIYTVRQCGKQDAELCQRTTIAKYLCVPNLAI